MHNMLQGKGREAALASGLHALHLPVPVARAAAPLPANMPAGSNPWGANCHASIYSAYISFLHARSI